MRLRSIGALLRRRGDSRGQSLVEFAMILPVFVLLFGATLDLGRLFYAQITLTNAAREGALQGARTPESYRSGSCDTANNLVVCRAVLESSGSFVEVSPGDVSMSCSMGCTKIYGNVVTVRIAGEFEFLTPVMAVIFGDTMDISTTASALVEALGS